MQTVRILMAVVALLTLTACAGSPARTAFQSDEDMYQDLSDFSSRELCAKYASKMSEVGSNPSFADYLIRRKRVETQILEDRGLNPNYCQDPVKYEELAAVKAAEQQYLAANEVRNYLIDGLTVTTEKRKTDICTSGGIYKIALTGSIGPDSSFAIEELLKRSPHCRNQEGQVIVATSVALHSGAGLLDDGYKLGHSLRKAGATTVIEKDTACASSCAVAFLGGKRRVVEDGSAILFHAPYYTGENAMGQKKIDCDVSDEGLRELNDYYVEMVGLEAGDRVYERTMWYCSAEDGWVISGSGAAELFKIATDRS